MANVTIGIDLGATKIQAAAMRDQAIIGTFRLATPQSGERDVSAAIVAASDAALAEAEAHRSEVRGVGIGAPGTIDRRPERSRLAQPARVPDRRTGPAWLDGLRGLGRRAGHDRQRRARGDPRRMEARRRSRFRNLLGVWVGTGVGGGLILNGEPYRGQGAAAEIGHIIVKPGGRVCSDGRKGHLEAYAGRGRMEVYARELTRAGARPTCSRSWRRRAARGCPAA